MITPLSFSSSTLSQLLMAENSSSTGPAPNVKQGAESFWEVLHDYMATAADTLRQGETAAIAGIEGKLPVQTVVEQVLAAERTVQAAVAVRDKLVSSFQEISRMQI